jgi:hypothetical protein
MSDNQNSTENGTFLPDDIVTRLRIIHCAADDLTPCGTCLTCQAADEIERLRNERDTERALTDQLARSLLDGSFRGNINDRRDRMYGSGWEAVHNALDAYEKARRG